CVESAARRSWPSEASRSIGHRRSRVPARAGARSSARSAARMIPKRRPGRCTPRWEAPGDQRGERRDGRPAARRRTAPQGRGVPSRRGASPMIVEILMGAGLVLAGAAAARVFLRRDAEIASAEGKEEESSPARATPRGLKVGDVLLHLDTELWLAGMIELDEEGFALRLFPSPGGLHAEWVAQLDEQATDLATLARTDEVPAGAVPESLPI